MTQVRESKNPIRSTREILAGILLILLLVLLIVINWGTFILNTIAFTAPEAPYRTLDEILSHPQPLIPCTYAVSTMHITPSGGMKGIYVEGSLGKGPLEPNIYFATQLNAGNMEVQSVYLTHLHFNHNAGILELLKELPYIAGKGEFYANSTFFMHGDHLATIDTLHQVDFSSGFGLPPLGKGVNIFGDKVFWEISSCGYSNGRVLFSINGREEQVLFTGDACNTQSQIDTVVGQATYLSNGDQARLAVERNIIFKQKYP